MGPKAGSTTWQLCDLGQFPKLSEPCLLSISPKEVVALPSLHCGAGRTLQ